MEREEINKHYTTVNCVGEIKSCYIRPVWDAKGRERAYDALTRERERHFVYFISKLIKGLSLLQNVAQKR